MAVAGKTEVLLAGMGEIKVARGAGVLGCIGLGSCVGTLLYDPHAGAGALAHVMLPEPHDDDALRMPGKYAVSAVPALLKELGLTPATASRLRAILIGGAEVFQNRESTLRIGERNVETLSRLLKELRISIAFSDTGGHRGRSFEFDLTTAELVIRVVGQPPQVHSLSRALGRMPIAV
ncbi:MAG: chemotaxis protein CheD [Armatimonadetes bacterium]|nr:chemotaxis protein CheD [Armatimonadota bacterium]